MKTETKKSFKDVIDNYHFEMFSEQGNKECEKIMKRVYDRVSGDMRISQEHLFLFIRNEVKKVEKSYPEINDTEPQNHIADLTRMICEQFDYNSDFDRFDIF